MRGFLIGTAQGVGGLALLTLAPIGVGAVLFWVIPTGLWWVGHLGGPLALAFAVGILLTPVAIALDSEEVTR